jgi:IS605 OrfB family transposase
MEHGKSRYVSTPPSEAFDCEPGIEVSLKLPGADTSGFIHREERRLSILDSLCYNTSMRLTAAIKLLPTPEQSEKLRTTLETANRAANRASEIAWEKQTFGQYAIHKLCYRLLRSEFGLSAQMAVRVIAKVSDAYKLGKKSKRFFRLDGAISYDLRILRYYADSVSIWTVEGREKIPFIAGAQQARMLKSQLGESDLVLRRGKWFLFAACEIVEAPLDSDPNGYLGVDFGIARLASDSTGESFSGAKVRNLRKRHRRLRAKLQGKGTKSSRRLLKKRREKESSFARDVNHCISKRLVEKAKRLGCGIALEDLKGIRCRIRARKSRRAELSSWSFGQLRAFIEYKARLAGVLVAAVNARNSSRECSKCGYVSKRNRTSQSNFQCRRCSFSINADINAARVLRSRALVNAPNAADCAVSSHNLAASPRL